MLQLTMDDQQRLAMIDIYCDYADVRGGRATTTNKKKKSVVRGEWIKTPVSSRVNTEKTKAAYLWLLANNATYKRLHDLHLQHLKAHQEDQTTPWFIATSFLLLHMDGVEVAARPVLYARSSFGDTDIKPRLMSLGHINEKQLPSIKTSFLRKYLSRCADYANDYLLFCLLHDISLARSLMQLVSIAEKKDMTADAAAQHLHTFDSYWRLQQSILEDKCRQLDRLPNLFITVAPAEWKFPLHLPTLGGAKDAGELSKVQGILTLHMHEARFLFNKSHFETNYLIVCKKSQVLVKGLRSIFKSKSKFFSEVDDYCMRIEFQGRGTLHVHCCVWATIEKTYGKVLDRHVLHGKSNSDHCSDLVNDLERMFGASVDVQVDDGTGHALLQYVTGYASKASDSLQFKSKEYAAKANQCNKWLCTYRHPFHTKQNQPFCS